MTLIPYVEADLPGPMAPPDALTSRPPEPRHTVMLTRELGCQLNELGHVKGESIWNTRVTKRAEMVHLGESTPALQLG